MWDAVFFFDAFLFNKLTFYNLTNPELKCAFNLCVWRWGQQVLLQHKPQTWNKIQMTKILFSTIYVIYNAKKKKSHKHYKTWYSDLVAYVYVLRFWEWLCSEKHTTFTVSVVSYKVGLCIQSTVFWNDLHLPNEQYTLNNVCNVLNLTCSFPVSWIECNISFQMLTRFYTKLDCKCKIELF